MWTRRTSRGRVASWYELKDSVDIPYDITRQDVTTPVGVFFRAYFLQVQPAERTMTNVALENLDLLIDESLGVRTLPVVDKKQLGNSFHGACYLARYELSLIHI